MGQSGANRETWRQDRLADRAHLRRHGRSFEVIDGGGGEGAARIGLFAGRRGDASPRRKSGRGQLSQSRDARTLDCRDLKVNGVPKIGLYP
jgi:hypothetical protein